MASSYSTQQQPTTTTTTTHTHTHTQMDTDSDTDSSDDFRSAHSVASVASVTPSDESEKENANSASSPRSFVTARSFTASSSSGAASNASNAANAVKKKVSFSAALASAFAPSPTPSNIHSTAKDLPLLQSDADLPPAFRAPLATTATSPSTSTSVNIEDFDADDDDDDDSLSTVTATTVANTRANSIPVPRTLSLSSSSTSSPLLPPHSPSSTSLNNSPRPPRLASLDIFRGLVILAMIIANYQTANAFPILLHPAWIGLSLADLVFPSFLFIMGVAIPISMKSGKKSYTSIATRSLKLIVIGLLLNAPFSTLETFRFAGVLQRTGLVFWVVASAYKAIPFPNMFNLFFPTFLLSLWAFATKAFPPLEGSTPFPDLPSCPTHRDTNFSYFDPPHCTAQSYFDMLVLGGRNHTYQHLPFDNEGTLSTLTSCITCIAGVIIGTSLQRAVQTDYSDGTWRYRQSLRMAVQALTCLVIGELVFGLLLGIPVSKNLWTPSFLGICLFFSIAGFGWCFWVVDGQPNVQSVVVVGGVGRRRIGVPSEQTRLLPGGRGGGRNGVSGRELPLVFNVLASCGRNPLFLFVLHELVAAFLGWIGWYEPLYECLFGWISVDGVGSLLWSLAWGLLVYAPIGVYLDHIRWYWRIQVEKMAESTAALAQLLVRLATQNDKAVEQQLDQLTHMHMHHYGLLLVAADASVPHSARHLAALYLKNGVDKHWRKTSKSTLQPDEKAAIRSFLSTLVCEESAKLVRAYAEAYSKIAQIDYPHDWPEAIPSLLTTIESTFNPASPFNQPVLQAPHDINALKRLHLAQQHSIYTLHRVIKGLYSVRTLRVKHVLYQMAPHIFQNLSNLFSSNISIFLANFPSTDPASTLTDPFVIEKLDGTIQIARLALKILRRLIVNGFPERDDMVRVPEGLGDGKMVAAPNFYKPFEKVEACVELFSSLTGCLQKMLQLRTAVSSAPQLKPIFQATTKISLTIGKLYTDLLNSRAVNFVAARGSLDVIRFYWGLISNGSSSGAPDANGNPDDFVERILLQGLVLFRGVIKNSQFSLMPPDRHPQTDDAIRLITEQLLTPDFVKVAMETLITKYLIFNHDELERWDEDPEGFMADEEADQWEFSLRMCGQKAVMDLMSKHRAILAPVLVEMLQQVAEYGPASNSNAILLKDAVYSAVSYCSYDLYDYLEFDNWFETRLLPESITQPGPDTNPMWKIIRRRVTMLISYWIAVKSAPSMRPLFYRLLIHLASPANERDMVVRLSAITTLRVVVDEGLLTDSEVFQPFVESCVQVLVELVVEADEFDTKVGGLTALKGIIYMMGQKIAPFAGKITEQLPRLWESSYDQIMFRTSILLVLSTLVQFVSKALKEQSVMLHPLVLPAIQATLLGSDMTQQMHFLEDSIDLWVATLQNSPSLTPELVSLYPCLAELIELGSAEHLKVVLRLLESYFVLDAGNFAQHPASLVLFTKLANYLSELKIEASKHIARAVTLVLRAGLQSNNLQAMQHLFVESKLLATLITEILQSSQKGIVDHVVADFTTVVSLFIVWDAGFIINYLQEFGIMVAGKGSSVLPECLDQWNRVECFVVLLKGANTDVLGKVQGIFATLSGVMMEVHGMSNEELSGSCARLHWCESIRSSTHSLSDDDEESPDRKRRALLESLDPIATTSLIPFIKEKLSACESSIGSQQWSLLLQSVDQDVANELFKLL
ncbi:ARM repeat-containing protein [Rhizoclosmatium globosum]|uniref:ARM repeat-containing protein n=1 Tax=Rhizoclosmatium globosum TaxID=329046 RepID=A0A1Y2BSH5_9FUNG|nr:ARM repeat-containing protein [Rhizoclosmatium globosum]|eukprot:ORY37075.1 ARM repeat-containing protein [Rhizoclosmatium globosum]